MHCVFTSPPYWLQRRYGAAGEWGSEPTLAEYIGNLVALFREIRRALRPDGTCWINLGDKYAADRSHGGYPTGKQAYARAAQRRDHVNTGFKHKDLMLLPARVAIALQDDGWYVRMDAVWNKPNGLPESVDDRPTRNHEYVFLLTKSANYWYDKTAVAQPVKPTSISRRGRALKDSHKNAAGAPGQKPQSIFRPRDNVNKQDALGDRRTTGFNERYEGRLVPMANLRSVWTIPPQGFKGAHFATFPPALPRIGILAGCPKTVCACCGAPYVRLKRKTFVPQEDVSLERGVKGADGQKPMYSENRWEGMPRGRNVTETLGWSPTCTCYAGTRPGIVYDPFMGSGTTARVAIAEGRHFIGTELNPEYVRMTYESLGGKAYEEAPAAAD